MLRTEGASSPKHGKQLWNRLFSSSPMDQIHEHNDSPAQFPVENLGLLPRGTVLHVAIGHGRNSIYLARLGFEVDGVEISREAVEYAVEAAKAAGARVHAQVADLEKDFHIPAETYDVIVCFNYL